jgi:hypothetical protein
MNPMEWAQIVKTEGFEVIFSGYFGVFDFWVDVEKRNYFKQRLIKFINRISPILKKILPDGSEGYSPYCGLIAKRSIDGGP